MGRIEYKHEGRQTEEATIYDNDGIKVADAKFTFGRHWTLTPENIPFEASILRALDTWCIYF